MKPAPFDYHAPASVAEALKIFAEVDDPDDVKVLAGGQSLMPLLALRLAQPLEIIDINKLDELDGISRSNGHVVIGATTRQRAAERDPIIQSDCPLLAQALPLWGHPQIRNRGTLGGSLAHADPAAEFPTIAAALDAELVVQGPGGERTVPASDFFRGFLTTALAADEILTAIRLPVLEGAGTAFEEVARRHGDFAMVGVAAVVRLDGGTVSDCRLAFSGVGSTPVRAREAEDLLKGESPNAAAITAAAERAASSLDPPSDTHASAAYRRHVARVIADRALTAASQRAEG